MLKHEHSVLWPECLQRQLGIGWFIVLVKIYNSSSLMFLKESEEHFLCWFLLSEQRLGYYVYDFRGSTDKYALMFVCLYDVQGPQGRALCSVVPRHSLNHVHHSEIWVIDKHVVTFFFKYSISSVVVLPRNSTIHFTLTHCSIWTLMFLPTSHLRKILLRANSVFNISEHALFDQLVRWRYLIIESKKFWLHHYVVLSRWPH